MINYLRSISVKHSRHRGRIKRAGIPFDDRGDQLPTSVHASRSRFQHSIAGRPRLYPLSFQTTNHSHHFISVYSLKPLCLSTVTQPLPSSYSRPRPYIIERSLTLTTFQQRNYIQENDSCNLIRIRHFPEAHTSPQVLVTFSLSCRPPLSTFFDLESLHRQI